jgi:hypothetical protein
MAKSREEGRKREMEVSGGSPETGRLFSITQLLIKYTSGAGSRPFRLVQSSVPIKLHKTQVIQHSLIRQGLRPPAVASFQVQKRINATNTSPRSKCRACECRDGIQDCIGIPGFRRSPPLTGGAASDSPRFHADHVGSLGAPEVILFQLQRLSACSNRVRVCGTGRRCVPSNFLKTTHLDLQLDGRLAEDGTLR